MAEKQIIPAVVGLTGGFVIAGGVIALMVGLGIITRFVGITHTAKHVKEYETAILAGAIFGNLLTVHQIRIPLGIFGLVLMGVLFGIFVGGWILALAEIVNIFPIFARRIGITKGYSLIVIAIAVGQTGDTGAQSAVEYAQSVCDRRRNLRDRTGNLKLWGYARTGKRHCSELVFPDPDFCQCDTHRSEYLSETCKVRRSRNAGADHWICQFGGSFCDRISERRAGFRDRMQDLYDCRTCDPVWDLLELGAGTDLLDLSGDCISNVR